MEYITGHQRATPQLVPCKITKPIMVSVMWKIWLTTIVNRRTKTGLPVHKAPSARYAKSRYTLYFHATCAHSAHIEKLLSAPCKSVCDLKTWKTTSEWNANYWSNATRSLLWHVGGEYASGNEQSLVWREIDAAFENRIATGGAVHSDVFARAHTHTHTTRARVNIYYSYT
ncbi:hypothetical protein ALC57_12552 [Trachymyrmex cornetzi]|uniref:Uncharacterized protein n=1 Tax=Trachymyrmex cornetzi TaxID=471704 RepID=A0A151J0T8_9HYME|nr:hypothetical protein ALC57_12552 [Trachymyrmex cornetzi]